MSRYLRLWARMARMSMQAQLTHRLGSVGFLLGKLIRIFFFFAYLTAVFRHAETVAGYTLPQIAVFFLTFNIVDITAQVFFRGIYGARRAIQDGDLDTYLTQPCSPLFRLACSSVDFLDVLTMIPVLALMGATLGRLGPLDAGRMALYLMMTGAGVAVAWAIHVFVAGLAVRTQELENTIWLYRDMMFLGKLPTDIYASPMRWALLTVIPIGVMVTLPAKAMLGLLSSGWAAYSLVFAAASVALSALFWRDALRRYTSVSS